MGTKEERWGGREGEAAASSLLCAGHSSQRGSCKREEAEEGGDVCVYVCVCVLSVCVKEERGVGVG